jgi:hypothetical protein
MRLQIIFAMATIFSSSDTPPLNSVINGCITDAILKIQLSRGKLFTFGAPID